MENHPKHLPVDPYRKKADRKLPAGLSDIELWQTNRRNFLKAALVAGTLSQLSFLQSCAGDAPEAGNEIFTAGQVKQLKSILLKLFPEDGNGPGAEQLHSFDYILWVLRDPGANADDNAYIIKGVDWINETTQELYQADYNELDTQRQETALEKFMELEYGNDWCSVLLTLVFESLLMDPIYGANPDGIGWKWLQHTPGQPQASEPLRYENILQTVRSAY